MRSACKGYAQCSRELDPIRKETTRESLPSSSRVGEQRSAIQGWNWNHVAAARCGGAVALTPCCSEHNTTLALSVAGSGIPAPRGFQNAGSFLARPKRDTTKLFRKSVAYSCTATLTSQQGSISHPKSYPTFLKTDGVSCYPTSLHLFQECVKQQHERRGSESPREIHGPRRKVNSGPRLLEGRAGRLTRRFLIQRSPWPLPTRGTVTHGIIKFKINPVLSLPPSPASFLPSSSPPVLCAAHHSLAHSSPTHCRCLPPT
jgi:hypothetical protein